MSFSAEPLQLALEERLRVWAIVQPEHGDFRKELLIARDEVIALRATLDASRAQAEALAEAVKVVSWYGNAKGRERAATALAAYRKGEQHER